MHQGSVAKANADYSSFCFNARGFILHFFDDAYHTPLVWQQLLMFDNKYDKFLEMQGTYHHHYSDTRDTGTALNVCAVATRPK